MVTGDPIAEGGDPGFRNKIFVAVAADTAGRMSMDAGYKTNFSSLLPTFYK